MSQYLCPVCQKQFKTQSGLQWHMLHLHPQSSEAKHKEPSISPIQENSNTVGTPECPSCGSAMVLRRVRKGPRAGSQFWGCSRYPNCETIMQTKQEEAKSGDSESASDVSFDVDSIPRVVNILPREDHLQVKAFQCSALPAKIVEAIHNNDVPRNLIRATTQWRLDFPRPKKLIDDNSTKAILSVAESLLTRGATPYCLPGLESLADISSTESEFDRLKESLTTTASSATCLFEASRFDSEEERGFYKILVVWNEALSSRCHIIPQVYLSSLSPLSGRSGNERVDFVLTRLGDPSIVVEIDGDAHQTRREKDQDRDAILSAAGMTVIRIPASEVRNGSGSHLDQLKQIMRSSEPSKREAKQGETPLVGVLRLYKLLHEVQLVILEAIRGGWLGDTNEEQVIAVMLPEKLADYPMIDRALLATGSSLAEFLTRLADLFGVPRFVGHIHVQQVSHLKKQPSLVITPALEKYDNLKELGSAPRFQISDMFFPGEISIPASTTSALSIAQPKKEEVKWFLDYLFRKKDFWEGQWEAVQRTLKGQDSVVLLPTGGGKSIAFQLAALLLPGRCIVVDPILSLIDDQIDNLHRFGIDRCIGITSQIRSPQQRDLILSSFSLGQFLFAYVAPERFQTALFRQHLRALTVTVPVSVIAVDEAHCVSEWGHDFRTAYLNLGRVARQYCTSGSQVPPLIALTGTASKIVLKDVQIALGITAFDAIITPKTFDRQELHYIVLKCQSSQKVGLLVGFLNRLPTDFGISRASFFTAAREDTASGLIFCPFVGTEFGVVEKAEQVSKALGVPVAYYAGGAPRGFDQDTWKQVKQDTAKRFKRNEIAVMACTNAYGMGIDKPNIRYTVHTGLPASIEAFYQEAGRAGRDRRKAQCAIILSDDNVKRTELLLNPGTRLDKITETLAATEREETDDITRALWFHTKAFRGEQAEMEYIQDTISRLSPLNRKRTVHLSATVKDSADPKELAQRLEKALHRLLVIGVIEDYTVIYPTDFDIVLSGASREEIARTYGSYAGAYSVKLGEKATKEALSISEETDRAYVIEVSRLLVSFIYTHIELARRRALREMLLAVQKALNGEDLRSRILEYLQHSEFDPNLEAVVGSSQGGIDALEPVLEDLVSPTDATTLRGSVARLLGSYPDNPGLLMLRSLSEALARDGDLNVARQDLRAALEFALGEYGIDRQKVGEACARIIKAAMRKELAANALLEEAYQLPLMDRILARELMSRLPAEGANIPAAWLLDQVISRSAAMRNIRRLIK